MAKLQRHATGELGKSQKSHVIEHFLLLARSELSEISDRHTWKKECENVGEDSTGRSRTPLSPLMGPKIGNYHGCKKEKCNEQPASDQKDDFADGA